MLLPTHDGSYFIVFISFATNSNLSSHNHHTCLCMCAHGVLSAALISTQLSHQIRLPRRRRAGLTSRTDCGLQRMQPAAPHAPVRARFPSSAACLVLLLLAFLSGDVGQQHVMASPAGRTRRLLDQTPQAAATGAAVSAGTGRRVPRWRAAERLGAVPLVLWQTFRTSQLPSAAQELVDTWHHKNPGLLMRLHNDTQASRFINRTFSQEVQRVYAGFPLGVMRADMWRYAILYARGGELLWVPSCRLGDSEGRRSMDCERARPPRHKPRQPSSPFATFLWPAECLCASAPFVDRPGGM